MYMKLIATLTVLCLLAACSDDEPIPQDRDAAIDDAGASDMSQSGLACLSEGDMMCNLECGEQICDGSSEYCLETPAGIDLAGFDLGGESGSSFECTPFPQECGANPTCECLGDPGEITECRLEAEGLYVVGLGV